jgi:hypothetical protein
VLAFAMGGAGFGLAGHPFACVNYIVVLGPWPLICCFSMFRDRRRRRGLHDWVAHTVVIDGRSERLV